MRNSVTTIKQLAFAWLLFAGNTNASIVVSNLNDDLLLQIENPISFEVTGALSTSRLGFLLPGAIDVSGSGGFSIVSGAASEPTLDGPGFFSGDPDLGLLRGGQDLEILYFLSGSINLNAGDRVTLSTGELVLPNFFAYSIINALNYSVATEAILSGTSGFPISELTSTVVPLPAALLLFSSAITLLLAGTRLRGFNRMTCPRGLCSADQLIPIHSTSAAKVSASVRKTRALSTRQARRRDDGRAR